MSLSFEDLDIALAYKDGEIGSEIVIHELDVQNLISGHESEGSGTVVDLDSQLTFSRLASTSAMSPDSGFEEDVRTPPASTAGPTLVVLEQPENTYRFRYLKESNKPHGPLKSEKCVGRTQKQSNGPRVKLFNFTGKAVIRMWLWGSKSEGPSPHRMVTQPGQDLIDEPHDIEVNADNNYTASFDKFNIVHVVTSESLYQKCYLKKCRNVKEEGDCYIPKGEIPEVGEFDAKQVKADWKEKEKDICSLYFEAFQKQGEKYIKICSVLSSPIKNTKSPRTTPPRIKKQSHAEGTCEGGTEILLFTDKLIKEISIVFECEEDGFSWQEEVTNLEFHKQVALSFVTPPFASRDITRPVMAKFYILRTTDRETSDYCVFRYMPARRDDYSYLGSGFCGACGRSVEAKRKRPQPQPGEDSMPPSSEILLTQSGIDLNEDLRELLQNPPFDFDELDVEGDVSTGDLIHTDYLHDISVYLDMSMDNPVAQGPCISDGAKSPKKVDLAMMSTHEKARLLHRSILARRDAEFKKFASNDTCNVHLGNKSPLHLAVTCGRPSMVARLLELGADPYALDGDSNTAVHVAIVKSQLCLQTMLSSAIEPRAVFNREGDDPVLFAVRVGNVTALRFLLTGGFRPFSRNVKDGDSPLHVAIKCKDQRVRREMVDLLLKHDALVSIRNSAELSPMDLAESVGDDYVIEKLKPFCVSDSDDDDRDIGDDDLAEKFGSLKLTQNSSAVRPSTESNPDCVPNKMYLALDGDVATSTKVAELMGFQFLMPVLANAQKQSQILLTYLERTQSREEAETTLNKHVLTARQIGVSSDN